MFDFSHLYIYNFKQKKQYLVCLSRFVNPLDYLQHSQLQNIIQIYYI